MENWVALNVPNLKGIFKTLNAEFTAYHPTDPAYLAWDGHGIELNPDSPKVGVVDLEEGEKGQLRGPFKTLFFLKVKIHCSETGELQTFPFSFGHVEAIDGPELNSWIRTCLKRWFEHEVDEAI